MYEWFFADMDSFQVGILCLCAFMVGVNKTGVPGIGILNVPLLALVCPAKASTGLLLPMLAIADLFAVAYYRRHAQWNLIFKLLPWSLTGIVAGSIVIRYINDAQLKPVIGIIVMAMLVMSFIRNSLNHSLDIPKHWTFAASMGFAAGLTTQLANASGPIMVIYLLAMQLPKEAYIGTGAWYFLILNWLKLPLFVWDGRVNFTTVRADLAMIPFIALGAWAGIVILKKTPQKWFNIIIQLLALGAALHLCRSLF